MKNELEKAQARYEKVCEKLDNLNDEAFELEKEMMHLKASEQKKDLFDLEALKPQLTQDETKTMEHIIYMAKETGQPQQADIGTRHIAVFPSGKMKFFTPTPKES